MSGRAGAAKGHLLAAGAPPLSRRMACFVYEGVLLFGVVMLAGLLFAGLFRQQHALQGQTGLRLLLFGVLGAYFAVFWTRGGQTLAMKTWRIRLLTRDGHPVSVGRALARYCGAWLWFLPALGVAAATGISGAWPLFGTIVTGVAAYAALTFLHPSGQFWHDIACGTMLVDTRSKQPTGPSKVLA